MDITADAGPDIPASCAGGGAGREGGTEGVGVGGGNLLSVISLPEGTSLIWTAVFSILGHKRQGSLRDQILRQVSTSGPPTKCLTSWKVKEQRGETIRIMPTDGFCTTTVCIWDTGSLGIFKNLFSITTFDCYYLCAKSKEVIQSLKNDYFIHLWYPGCQV